MKPLAAAPSLAEQAYQAILDEICEGRLPAGAHLVQEQLAKRLGVSRQPIQQAMALLKSDGLVEDAPGRGLAVTALDMTMMRQHYEIRAALDGLAARLAAGRAGASKQTAAEIRQRGGEIIEEGQGAVAEGDIARMVRCDFEFHGLFYAVSGNPLLEATAAPHWRYLRRVMGEVLRKAEPPADIWRQHREILDSVAKGRAEHAQDCAIHHVELAARELERASERRLAG